MHMWHERLALSGSKPNDVSIRERLMRSHRGREGRESVTEREVTPTREDQRALSPQVERKDSHALKALSLADVAALLGEGDELE